MKTPIVVALCLMLGACTTAPTRVPPPDIGAAISGEAILGRPLDPARLPDDQPLTLTPQLRAYLATIAPGRRPDQRLAALIRAFEAREFHVDYDSESTLTASETYAERRGNCMAFTLMMVAMARELGADAYFNQVDVPPVWGQDEPQSFVIYRHINMVSESSRGRRVVDFNLAAYDPVYDQIKLTDTEALAQYYSNRGVELMRHDRSEEAFLYLRKALQLRPGGSDLWSNLGSLYSRLGYRDEAEQSYRQALALNSGHLVAISNLERLYRSSGRIVLADEYAERARYHRERNPYYLYYQARTAYEHGDYPLAKKQLKHALRQYEDDHRFHFLMALTKYRMGDMEGSREDFREAFLLAENQGTRNAYLHKLEYLQRAQPDQKVENSSPKVNVSRRPYRSNLDLLGF
ncbi:tetratricopeptide repeat protein [Microbulbifer hainanensis]|uniref:tetratricopeptide repeat protein n=1 Tax=Microbulbifer hainanensis TaxID=2735675 RepID=UPI001866CD1A|nr:tetratricopeptide repeat protein [Microbulbifer hainanensis]